MQNKIGFLRSYGAFWKHYADFSSRTPKEAFWKAWVVHSAAVLASMSPLYYIYYNLIEKGNMSASLWVFPLVAYAFATFIPTIAIILRRLHDIDRSGGWFFLFLVPYAGMVAFFIMLTRPSAPYDVFPGLSGRGPYNEGPQGGQPYGRPDGQEQNAGRPDGQEQNAGRSDGQEQNPYSPSYGQAQNPYSPSYGQAQSPYSPSYGQEQNPYSPSHGRAPVPYGQAYAPAPQNPYAQRQGPYGAQPYTQQPYAPRHYWRRPPNPRRFAPLSGGNRATAAIVASIVIAVVTMAYSVVASNYLQNNIDKYISTVFGDSFWGDYSGGMYDNYDYWGDDYGWSDDDYYGWDYGDGWGDEGQDWDNGDGYGPGGDAGDGLGGDGYMAEERLAAIDLVRESALDGFPDYSIEDVLLAYVNEEGLVWDCNVDGGPESQDLLVTAYGTADGSFESVFADFFVYGDGTVALYDLGYGNRWENEKDALELYAELYNGMVLKGDANV